MARTWRLLVDGAGDGAWNMGVDCALLASRAEGGPPTLRVYGWEWPTVSLGRFQARDDVDLAVAGSRRVGVVRRPTGGRGVLHDREVTYSVAASEADGVPRGTAASYRMLCGGLVEAYRLLGVDATLTGRERGPRSGACYLHATRADLSAGGVKLSGSAQVWRSGAVLQHGSVVIARDVALESSLFRLDDEGAGMLRRTAASLGELLAGPPSAERVVEALTSGFASALGVSLIAGALTGAEREHALAAAAAARVAERLPG